MSIRRLLSGGAAAAALLAALPGVAAAADGGEINTGDTAWMLMSTALVMVMLPGLALFYGGLVRRKNVLSTTMHSFFGLALVSIVWVIVGFTLAFGTDVHLPDHRRRLHRRPRVRDVQRRRPGARRPSTP